MQFEKHRKIAAKVQTGHTMRSKYFAHLREDEIKGHVCMFECSLRPFIKNTQLQWLMMFNRYLRMKT